MSFLEVNNVIYNRVLLLSFNLFAALSGLFVHFTDVFTPESFVSLLMECVFASNCREKETRIDKLPQLSSAFVELICELSSFVGVSSNTHKTSV